MMRFAPVFLVVALLPASCAAASQEPVTIPASAVASSSSLAPLDRGALVEEAVDPHGLGAALDDAGFQAGAERVALDRTAPVRETRVRVLRFAAAAGARAWLSYAGAHPIDVVGDATREDPAGDALVFHHVPGGCCPGKDLASWTALVAGGPVVTMVTVWGPDVTRDDLLRAMTTAGMPEPA